MMETKIYYSLDYIGQNIKECQELEKQGKLEEAKNKEKVDRLEKLNDK